MFKVLIKSYTERMQYTYTSSKYVVLQNPNNNPVITLPEELRPAVAYGYSSAGGHANISRTPGTATLVINSSNLRQTTIPQNPVVGDNASYDYLIFRFPDGTYKELHLIAAELPEIQYDIYAVIDDKYSSVPNAHKYYGFIHHTETYANGNLISNDYYKDATRLPMFSVYLRTYTFGAVQVSSRNDEKTLYEDYVSANDNPYMMYAHAGASASGPTITVQYTLGTVNNREKVIHDCYYIDEAGISHSFANTNPIVLTLQPGLYEVHSTISISYHGGLVLSKNLVSVINLKDAVFKLTDDYIAIDTEPEDNCFCVDNINIGYYDTVDPYEFPVAIMKSNTPEPFYVYVFAKQIDKYGGLVTYDSIQCITGKFRLRLVFVVPNVVSVNTDRTHTGIGSYIHVPNMIWDINNHHVIRDRNSSKYVIHNMGGGWIPIHNYGNGKYIYKKECVIDEYTVNIPVESGKFAFYIRHNSNAADDLYYRDPDTYESIYVNESPITSVLGG